MQEYHKKTLYFRNYVYYTDLDSDHTFFTGYNNENKS